MNSVNLRSLDRNEVLFHFTKSSNLEAISSLGLLPMIGKNSMGIENTKKVFFSKGYKGFLEICDVWINWLIYTYGFDKFVSDSDREYGFREVREEYKKFFKQGLYNNQENRMKAFSMMKSFMEENIVLSLDLTEGVEYESDDIDEAKIRANDTDFIRYIYCNHVNSDTLMDPCNMHTKSDLIVSSDKITLVDCDGELSALYLLDVIYEEEKNNNSENEFLLLDDFMEYVRSFNEKKGMM